MASKGLSAPISQPTGGGGLQGLGEKFTPDLHTGTANFSVPLDLPRGRLDFGPALSLNYSSGSGSGPFGLGWSLSVPGISRLVSKGVPLYDDVRDTFVLGGGEDLLAVGPFHGQPGVTLLRPRTDALFAQVLHYRDATNSYWEVRSRDGTVNRYGTPGLHPDDPTIVADPARRDHILAWRLASTRDSFGNTIVYDYVRDAGRDGPHHWDQLYLAHVRYGDRAGGGTPDYLVSVEFVYEDRPDARSDYRGGFEVRTRRRCSAITIRSHSDGDRRLHTYRLIYLDQRDDLADLAAQLPPNGVSLLSRIQLVHYDDHDTPVIVRPPVDYGYTTFDPRRRHLLEVTGRQGLPGPLSMPDLELVDLFGSGLPDLVQWNGDVRYWRNLGNGRFDIAREMAEAPAGISLLDPGVQFVDANGDGRTDLMVTREAMSGYFPMGPRGLWDDRSFQRFALAPSFDLRDPDVKLVDLDGDGTVDCLRTGARLECFFNDPERGWYEARSVERGPLDVFPNVNFSDPRVFLVDMTGDGLQDIALVHNRTVEYWPHLGRGRFAPRVHMRNSPQLPADYNPGRVLLGDLDGDGAADLAYVEDTRVTAWFNRCGNSWSDPIVIEGTPPVSDLDGLRLVDLLGQGVAGILWSLTPVFASRPLMYFLDLTAGRKPYLLDRIDTHMGAVTDVEYAPSTRFYLEDEQRRATRWKTSLPFPVQVVARYVVYDKITGGKLSHEYLYHHGSWDGGDREFRGFGRVDERDTQSFDDFHLRTASGTVTPIPPEHFSPPTLQKTWFHQGAVGDAHGDWSETDLSEEFWSGDRPLFERPATLRDAIARLPRPSRRDAWRAMRGTVLRSELFGLDGSIRASRPYTVTESLPGAIDLFEGKVFFAPVLAERTTQWERGDDPMTRITLYDGYDAYGAPRSKIDLAVPRGRDCRVALPSSPPEPYLATHTIAEYAHRDDALRYHSGLVSRTTLFEIPNDGRSDLESLAERVRGGSLDQASHALAQTVNYYDGAAFVGLPLGQVGDFGAMVRSEMLTLTPGRLADGYRSGDAATSPPETPPYLQPGGPVPWSAEYPVADRGTVPPLAGYAFHPGSADPLDLRGYYSVALSRRFDVQSGAGGCGLILAARDELGRETTTEYDPQWRMFPIAVTDAAGLTTRAAYSFRHFRPTSISDVNDNQTTYVYAPSATLAAVFVRGKAGEGDVAVPSATYTYDWLAFMTRGQPASSRTTLRRHHDTESGVPPAERDAVSITVQFSDGLGRSLQTRALGESVVVGQAGFGGGILPADQSDPSTLDDVTGAANTSTTTPNVLVSGWQIYDNRGRVVEKFEPYYATGWDYAPPGAAQLGQRIQRFYDALGHVVRVVNADGSEQVTVHGVPGTRAAVDLADPAIFEPTPWEGYTYDANDNAGRTHPSASVGYSTHWNTPTSTLSDALGRTIAVTQRNGPNPLTDWFTTRSRFDIQGNLLSVTDTLGRIVLRQMFDCVGNSLRVEGLDDGVQRRVWDAKRTRIEQRDSRGALTLFAADAVNRPVRVWARDDASGPTTLRERLIYGDTDLATRSPAEQAAERAANRLGKLARHYDEAGVLTCVRYDFKGNVLDKTRRVVADTAVLATFGAMAGGAVPAFHCDWESPSAVQLEAADYRTTIAYDALGRVTRLDFPAAVDGGRRRMQPQYNEAGALRAVSLDGVALVEEVFYTAKGQRTLVVYGNGLMSRVAYDPQTFRPVRLRTEACSRPSPLTWRPAGPVRQDSAYTYDLSGNVLAVDERVPGCGVTGTLDGADALLRQFAYDPSYRLRSATGRECKSQASPRPWGDDAPCGFGSGSHGTPTQDNAPSMTAAYTERYEYDPAGNLTKVQHLAGASSSWTRGFGMDGMTPAAWASAWAAHLNVSATWSGAPGNRMDHVGDAGPGLLPTHRYDAAGNLVQEENSRFFEWNYRDQLRAARTQAGTAQPSVYVWCLYDATGQRVKRIVRRQGGQVESTVYIDGLFDHRRESAGGTTRANNLIRVTDHKTAVAQVRVGPAFPGEVSPAVQFTLEDCQRSIALVVDDTGAWVNREEFYPYGDSSFGSYRLKRYRFAGKERDEATGLYYFGARYYASWLGRWASCDPEGIGEGVNAYQYARANPMTLTDPDGRTSISANGQFYPDSPSPNWPRPKFTGGVGDEAHRDILFHLQLRLWVAGYDTTTETRTLTGGLRRGTAKGEVDLIVRKKEEDVSVGHVYDLKPQSSGQKYKKFLERYVSFGEKLLRPGQPLFYKAGTILETAPGWILGTPIVVDKQKFFRVYWTWLPRDATGAVVPGYIEYTYKDYLKDGTPVTADAPETKKKKTAKAVAAAPASEPSGGAMPVPALASTPAAAPAKPTGLTEAQQRVAANDQPIVNDLKPVDDFLIRLGVTIAVVVGAALGMRSMGGSGAGAPQTAGMPIYSSQPGNDYWR